MLNIPEKHVEYLRIINNLTPEERVSLKSALDVQQSKDCLSNFADSVAAIAKIEKDKTIAVLAIVGSVASTASRFSKEKKSVIDDLIETLRDSDGSEPLSEDAIKFILESSDNESIHTTLKCERLKEDFDSTIDSIRVLTDLRPVFSSDARTICSSFVVNTLNINFTKNDESFSQYIAMTEEDIDSLISTLERAKNKIAALKDYSSKMSHI